MVHVAIPGNDQVATVLAGLGEVERRWREALSLVLGDEPEAAVAEVEAAGRSLEGIPTLPETALADPRCAAEYHERLKRLSALHARLLAGCSAGLSKVEGALSDVRRGGRVLQAYSSRRPESRGYDRLT